MLFIIGLNTTRNVPLVSDAAPPDGCLDLRPLIAHTNVPANHAVHAILDLLPHKHARAAIVMGGRPIFEILHTTI